MSAEPVKGCVCSVCQNLRAAPAPAPSQPQQQPEPYFDPVFSEPPDVTAGIPNIVTNDSADGKERDERVLFEKVVQRFGVVAREPGRRGLLDWLASPRRPRISRRR